jgi:RNA polymerase sigma factor (sigma-70 family)
MAKENLNVLLKRLTRGLASEALNDLSDEQLLEQFIGQGKDAAFETIVRRHGPMVYRVCWRMLRHTEDAEDAFQATFLLLAKKASSIRKRASLASWLHGVAARSASKTQAQSALRSRHEKKVPTIPSVPTDEAGWKEVRSLLDDELQALPDKHRLPLILCYLEGRTQDEAADQLGWSTTTLRRRLDEARMALGRRLDRRGVILSAALCGLLFTDCASWAAVPPRLIVSTIDAAVQVAAGHAVTGVVSAKVAAITEGLMKTMVVSKLKIAAAVMLIALAGLGTSVIMAQADAMPPAKQEPVAQVAEAPAPANKQAAKEEGGAHQQLQKWTWNVVAVDDVGKSISLQRASQPAGFDMNATVAPDAKIKIDGRDRRLADLRSGAVIIFQMAKDRPIITQIEATTTRTVLKGIDVDKNTITVTVGGEEWTAPMASDAKIILRGNVVQLSDLKAGMLPGHMKMGVEGDRIVIKLINTSGQILGQ